MSLSEDQLEGFKLEPEMIAFLDERLKDNGLAQHAIATKDGRLLLVETAKVCVGIREKTGNNDGPMVELIQKTIDGQAEHEPWCMAFVQTCIAYVVHTLGIPSKIAHSEHCLTVWKGTPIKQRVREIPLPGAIAIYKHGTTQNGHTEIVLACDGKTLHNVGGNTTGSENPNKPIDREGNGVFYTVRPVRPLGSMKLVGFLKPF